MIVLYFILAVVFWLSCGWLGIWAIKVSRHSVGFSWSRFDESMARLVMFGGAATLMVGSAILLVTGLIELATGLKVHRSLWPGGIEKED